MKKARTSKVASKIRQLATIAAELREGASFNITRLTTIKGLCEDPQAAARFAVFVSEPAVYASFSAVNPESSPL